MAERLVGNSELLLTPEEDKLFEQQADAQRTADVTKEEADYQNEPKDGEQCDGCSRFVEGLSTDIGGYCRKVRSFRGPEGIIFTDGWCKFFKAAERPREK